MIYFYYLISLLVILSFGIMVIRNLRDAVMVGLVFCVFTLDGLPWHFLPQGTASGILLLFLYLSFLLYIVKQRTNLNTFKVSKFLILLLVFWCLVLFNNIQTSSNYGISKTTFFFFKGILPILGLSVFRPISNKDSKKIIYTIVIGSFLLALKMVVLGDIYSYRGVGNLDISPITVARNIGLGTILIGLLGLLEKKQLWRKITDVGIFGILIFMVMTTGARGPLLSIIITVLVSFIIFNLGSKIKVKIFFSIVIMVLGILILFSHFNFYQTEIVGIKRIFNYIVHIGKNSSDLGRLDRLKAAWEGFVESKGLGLGTGGFSKVYKGIDGSDYPHNIIMETLVEQGVIGFGILLLLLCLTFNQLIKLLRKYDLSIYKKCLLSLWFYTFLNASVSGDFGTNYLFWISGIFPWLLNDRLIYEGEDKNEEYSYNNSGFST